MMLSVAPFHSMPTSGLQEQITLYPSSTVTVFQGPLLNISWQPVAISAELRAEFEAWDAASDEALGNE